jgi:hypothetical protein
MTVCELDRERLARILGLLGSAHAGERAAAGAKADQLIRLAGLTWAELIASPAQPLTRYSGYDGGEHRKRAWWALDLAEHGLLHLSGFESSFLKSVSRWRGALTDRQQTVWGELFPQLVERSGQEPP